jgi:hypothetical protein
MRTFAVRYPNQPPARERVERPLAKPTQSSHGSPTAGDDHLAPGLNTLQVLAKAVMQLPDPNFALGLM